jgi:hypothetical protein
VDFSTAFALLAAHQALPGWFERNGPIRQTQIDHIVAGI